MSGATLPSCQGLLASTAIPDGIEHAVEGRRAVT